MRLLCLSSFASSVMSLKFDASSIADTRIITTVHNPYIISETILDKLSISRSTYIKPPCTKNISSEKILNPIYKRTLSMLIVIYAPASLVTLFDASIFEKTLNQYYSFIVFSVPSTEAVFSTGASVTGATGASSTGVTGSVSDACSATGVAVGAGAAF